MRTYASPRRGHCASCEGRITGRPVYLMDEAYCCVGCAQGAPCVCTYEADMADDGVDHLGLPFATPEPVMAEAQQEEEIFAGSHAQGVEHLVPQLEGHEMPLVG